MAHLLLDFISFYLIVLNFAMNLKDAIYKNHWNIFRPTKMISDLNIYQWKMSDFVSFPLLGFILVIKVRKFDFSSHWSFLIVFNKNRYDIRFEYVPWKNVWFCSNSIVCIRFSHKTEKLQFWKSLKYFDVFW